ncbi:hypothetical protein CULT_840002 [[Clostridium] ultunense Esp]|nr:hypothetical protein CULT_840002 [[Clostridium] ultunense Esp]
MPLWLRGHKHQNGMLNKIKLYRYSGTEKLPFAKMGGELVFAKANEALILLI